MIPPLRDESPCAVRAGPAGLVLITGASLCLAACAGPRFIPPSKTGTARAAGGKPAAAAKGAPAQPAGDLNRAALDMRQLMDRLDAKPPESASPRETRANSSEPAPQTKQDSREPVETAGSPIPVETGAWALGGHEPIAARPIPPVSAESPQERRKRLVGELALALEDEAKAAGCEPLRDGLRLLALDMLHPGGVEPELRAVFAGATPPEGRTLQELREMFRRLAPESVPGDVMPPQVDSQRVARVLAEHAAELGSQQPLRISRAALCTSVESFGRYAPFASNVFLRGKAHAAILYVAVENFAQRRAVAGANGAAAPSRGTTLADDAGDWTVDLSEAVSLFHDSDNLEVWALAEEGARDAAREKRDDYYLVRRVQLPASLSLGRYNLKVTVKDRGGGGTAQATIPIEIVADPSLARAHEAITK